MRSAPHCSARLGRRASTYLTEIDQSSSYSARTHKQNNRWIHIILATYHGTSACSVKSFTCARRLFGPRYPRVQVGPYTCASKIDSELSVKHAWLPAQCAPTCQLALGKACCRVRNPSPYCCYKCSPCRLGRCTESHLSRANLSRAAPLGEPSSSCSSKRESDLEKCRAILAHCHCQRVSANKKRLSLAIMNARAEPLIPRCNRCESVRKCQWASP